MAEKNVEAVGYVEALPPTEREQRIRAEQEFRMTGKLPKGYSVACHSCMPVSLFKSYDEYHNHMIRLHGKIGTITKIKENK